MNPFEFRDALLDPARPLPEGITDPQGNPAPKRFAVYRNNVTVGLAQALDQSFPVLRKLLGADFFAALARSFLRAHPPSSPVMMAYGDAMPDFLAAFEPVAHLPYLPDVARLEIAIRQSYHAADAAPLPLERFHDLTPGQLASARVTFAPALRLIRSAWPVHAIWATNAQGAPPPPQPEAQDVLVTRRLFDPAPVCLPPRAADFILGLTDGMTVAQAADHAGDCDLTLTFALLLSGGAIISMTHD